MRLLIEVFWKLVLTVWDIQYLNWDRKLIIKSNIKFLILEKCKKVYELMSLYFKGNETILVKGWVLNT